MSEGACMFDGNGADNSEWPSCSTEGPVTVELADIPDPDMTRPVLPDTVL